VAVPEQPPPDQPANVEPEAGASVSVTLLPWLNENEQVLPQLIPAGLLVTDPLPVPDSATPNVFVVGPLAVNVAVTFWSLVIGTTQVVAVPEQPPPDQPANVVPEAGLSVRVTLLPLPNDEEQVLPQLIPAGELVTPPLPVPFLDTVNVCDPPAVENVSMLPDVSAALLLASSSKQ
jgi:hypothetical protein